jgi:hypothetical protein
MSARSELLKRIADEGELKDVLTFVELIREMRDDDEVAHGMEDDLHTAVLSAIAADRTHDAAALARAALSTRDIDFARWCS